ncbi:PAS domain-containing protein [Allochromatium tepidum]|uniref:PAS fold-4 domain-containing protein n=1 Tax=Allochromatium tepidum TaxID=553982 RepID=A0ABM7QKX0_9GAMM|nr:PAS domain-containing protein [Allochromatium tepidum]BCU06356.1 hypothetical protein Atep_10330 [Allochromatium tepidum]
MDPQLSIPDLFFLFAPDGTILEFRGPTDRLYVPPEHFIGKHPGEVLPAEVGALFDKYLETDVQSAELVSFQYVLPMADGPREFEARICPLGADAQFLVIVCDLTERQHLLQALDHERRQLSERIKVAIAAAHRTRRGRQQARAPDSRLRLRRRSSFNSATRPWPAFSRNLAPCHSLPPPNHAVSPSPAGV